MANNIPIKERGTGKLIVNLIPGLTAAESYFQAIDQSEDKYVYDEIENHQLIIDAFNAGQKYEQNR